MDRNRGTGRTMAQIRNATLGAAYVCKTHAVTRHAAMIAGSLGRNDLKFVSEDQVSDGVLRGWSNDITWDHDCFKVS